LPPCRYAKLSPQEIRLDRYAKFRKLGQWEEFLVQGGHWREAREARAKVDLDHLYVPHMPQPKIA
jgi:acetyl-CoA carboxylase carboxyl transferase subunit alpha